MQAACSAPKMSKLPDLQKRSKVSDEGGRVGIKAPKHLSTSKALRDRSDEGGVSIKDSNSNSPYLREGVGSGVLRAICTLERRHQCTASRHCLS